MSRETMTASLARSLKRAGWRSRDIPGMEVELVLEWGGTPPTTRLLLVSGGAILMELDTGLTTHWEAVTPDNLTRVSHYIEETIR